MAFPGSIPSYAGFTGSHTLSADNHAAQHNAEQADISALATKLGTGASTPASGLVLRSSGAGVSAWGQVILTSDVSGVLPVANGGTGQANLTALPLLNPAITGTVTGGATYSSPVLTTPTIADFTNATHDHSTNSKGGQIANTGISGVGAEKLSNPYKFSAYRNAAVNSSASLAAVTLDTELFDTNNNYDTSNGRYTAPVSGFYYFACAFVFAATSGDHYYAALMKNATEIQRFTEQGAPATTNFTGGGAGFLQLTAGDYVQAALSTGTIRALTVGNSAYCWFVGFLVSVT